MIDVNKKVSNIYTLDPLKSIYIRNGHCGIDYSDGDQVENNILNIIKNAKDVSVHSSELRAQCVDWPTTYHFSAVRSNIMRPFKENLKGAYVLEIGAGCGAITRFLGECEANVHALEGSIRRAEIARLRTKDLDNVDVICERFDKFESEIKYDFITLIGVLEYASIFTSGENATLRMLDNIKQFLKEDGTLVIAIENQLGLKYFSGFPEDHVWRVMDGVEDRYADVGPRTFGRKELEHHIKSAGFSHVDFMSPYPDYKMPNSIVTEMGLMDEDFDAASLAQENVHRDYQRPNYLYISQEFAWPVIHKNGLAMDMANSFLITAKLTNKKVKKENILAYHFSSNRSVKFCKELLFVKDTDGVITVKAKRPFASILDINVNDGLSNEISFNSEYIYGRKLIDRMQAVVSSDFWDMHVFAALLKKYISFLFAQHHKINVMDYKPSYVEEYISGSYIDCTPQNILFGKNEELFIIDQEWVLDKDIPIGLLVFRTLIILIQSLTRFGLNESLVGINRRLFINEVFKHIGFEIDEEKIREYESLEEYFQSKVLDSKGYQFNWFPEMKIPFHQVSDLLIMRTEELQTAHHVIENKYDELNAITAENNNLRSHLDLLRAECSELTDVKFELKVLTQKLNELREEKEVAINTVHLTTQQFTQQLNELRKEKELAIDTVHLIQSSKIWRMSKPLREISKQITIISQKIKLNKNYLRIKYIQTRFLNGVKKHGIINSIPLGYNSVKVLIKSRLEQSNNRKEYDKKTALLCDKIKNEGNFIDIFHVAMGWNTPLFQRFQHISIQSAKLGGLSLYGGHKQVDKNIFVCDEVANNLFVFDALDFNLRERLFKALRENTKATKIIRIQSIDLATGIDEIEKYISDGFKIVYEYIDEVSDEITGGIPDFIIDRHHWALKNELIVVITTANNLFNDALKYRKNNIYLSTNGVDVMHWAVKTDTPPIELADIVRKQRIIVGYHGALAQWVDYDLLHRIAEDGLFELLLIGHEHDSSLKESKLLDRDNVHFLGSRSYFELPKYASFYDIGILPFKKYKLTESVSPVKLFEYMALGKPIVTTDLPECLKYESCLVAPSNDYEMFIENLHIAVFAINCKEYRDSLRKDAMDNSWEEKTINYLTAASVKLNQLKNQHEK
ncbi:glycosyltransferase [Aeromonas encheleia]|uniref:Glycosyltransferase n=1 Tax=Aeromonas encheleia TaxID=73010 RepID=A0AAE9MHF5_9GAMM|nr:glycosyltransferase [Aeromonas encheleia]USV58815.1 glycosyltransferase [Aeromonas encheleia]